MAQMIVRKVFSTIQRVAPLSTSAICHQREILDATEDLAFEAEQRIADEEKNIMLRNKSRLRANHRVMERGEPGELSDLPYFKTIHLRRRMFAKYGESSGVNKGIAWPTKGELQSILEYQSLAEGASAKELIDKAWKEHNDKKAAALEADRKIHEKVGKREKDIEDFLTRQKKKAQAARKVVEEKERLMAEVREHFGYDIDPRSEEVKAMIDEKAKEQRKLIKEAKKKAKADKSSAFMAAKGDQPVAKQNDDSETK